MANPGRPAAPIDARAARIVLALLDNDMDRVNTAIQESPDEVHLLVASLGIHMVLVSRAPAMAEEQLRQMLNHIILTAQVRGEQ